MRSRWFAILSLILVSGISLYAFGQDKPLEKQQKPDSKQIQAWVESLGSENLEERENAITKLFDLGVAAAPYLEQAIQESPSREVRWNAKRLLREIREQKKEAVAGQAQEWSGRHQEWEERLRGLEEQLQRGFPITPGISGSSVSITQSENGIHVEIVENIDGEKSRQIYAAGSVEEFQNKYPEIAQKYGIGKTNQGFFFQIPDLNLEHGQEQGGRDSFPLPPARDRLGVYVDHLDASLSSFVGLERGMGLIVRSVEPNSLAEKMGITENDILISINEQPIKGTKTVLATLSKLSPGDEVRIELERSKQGRFILKGKKPLEDKPLEAVDKK